MDFTTVFLTRFWIGIQCLILEYGCSRFPPGNFLYPTLVAAVYGKSRFSSFSTKAAVLPKNGTWVMFCCIKLVHWTIIYRLRCNKRFYLYFVTEQWTFKKFWSKLETFTSGSHQDWLIIKNSAVKDSSKSVLRRSEPNYVIGWLKKWVFDVFEHTRKTGQIFLRFFDFWCYIYCPRGF